MNTLELNHEISLNEEVVVEKSGSFYKKAVAAIDAMEARRAGWFMGALLAQGVLFLPIPAVLMYYYNAPVWVLAVTILLFFSSFVAGMCGSKLKVLIALLAAGLVINLVMILAFVL